MAETNGFAVLIRKGNSIWHAVAEHDDLLAGPETCCGIRYTADLVRREADWHDLLERPKPLPYGEAGVCSFCLRATSCSDDSSDKEAS